MELRIGVIGIGAMGRDHVDRINNRVNGAKVSAISDINVEVATAYAKEIGSTFYEDAEALIAADEIDGIVVTSWDPTHEGYVLEAIKHDKYVFCEKPLALEASGCTNIVNAETAKQKRLVQVGFMRRYDRGYEEMKRELDTGVLGEPLLLHCTHRNETVDSKYDTPMAVENTAVHEVDALRWLLQEDFVSAQVILPKKQTQYTHPKLHDPQLILLQTESGVCIDLEVFVNCQFGYDINCKVVCEKGEIGLTNPTYFNVKTEQKDYTRVPSDWKERFISAYDKELQLWVDGIKHDEITGPSAWDGYMASVTTNACSESRDNGYKVEIKFDEKPSLYQ
ncbi:Gfo/Idh/MocA family oxidoreductase [Staphylococcus gallinarum]|uniref:Gfo/Idh/MocA family protein n=1 Tax=Staphylococcus gallinarum TaxID=1293 RepID=UPI001E32DF52|nr:Gfo/Idh/MocA family oxidoreductase [Staphylococcus gallinarum]MCD8909393.1 Gfo/Idh/MocA family oxidoreductase [Staphylococcus gallinarum]